MKNIVLLTIVLIALTTSSFGQKAEVEEKLQEYGIPADFFVDKENKRLDKVDFSNVGTVKIKMFNVNKLDMTMYYKRDEESKTYLLDKETLMFDTHVLGQPVEVKETSEYYNYKKAG